jgi:hypothetical protein
MSGQSLDMTGLLKAFQAHWAEASERCVKDIHCLEMAPHCVMLAFLRRVANGGAIVIPEYANGLGCIDINVKYAGRDCPIELKLRDVQDSWAASGKQLLGYMERLLASEGWLVVFGRKSNKSRPEKIYWKTKKTPQGQTIHVAGC